MNKEEITELAVAIEKYEKEYQEWKFYFLVERLINPTSISWSELTKDKPIKENYILNVRLNFIIKEKLIRDEFTVGTWNYEITQKGINYLKDIVNPIGIKSN